MPLSFDDLPPADAALIQQLVPLNEGLRGGACTIARIGVRFRRAEPQRTARWIEILEPHPFYKLGQVMFDLLEWEDFMLDGEEPAPSVEDVTGLANRLLQSIDLTIDTVNLPLDLPQLETGFYLYRDVVLGLIWLAIEAHPAKPEAG